jgi:hypothetical protein
MRQLSCMSADVYCQKLNTHFQAMTSYLYSMERRGKGLAAGETERVCVREMERG